MTARETLQELRIAADELQELYRTRAGVFDMLTSATTRITPTGTRGTGDVHRLDVLGEVSDRVDAQIAVLAGMRARALDLIARLDDSRQRSVLIAYYVNAMDESGRLRSWEDVAAALHMSRSTARRTHAAALAAVEKLNLNEPAGA